MNVVGSFGDGVESRKVELDYLLDSLSDGMKIVTDTDTLNSKILASDRPELVITESVPQAEISWPYRPRQINNFSPNMRGFGIPVFEMVQESWEPEANRKYMGRTWLDDDELALYYEMGARGDYDEHHAYAEKLGIDREMASDMMLQSHLKQASFMRMWIAMPEITVHLMMKCLDEYPKSGVVSNTYEEIYVAYSLMSKLVDAKDSYVQRSNGEIDNRILCR